MYYENLKTYVKAVSMVASMVTSSNGEQALDEVLKIFNDHLLTAMSDADGETWMENNNVRAFYANWVESGYEKDMIPVVKTSPTMRKYTTILKAYSGGESDIVYKHPISGGASIGAWSMGDIDHTLCDKFVGVSSEMVFSHGSGWTLGSLRIIDQDLFDRYVLMDSSGYTVGSWDTVKAASVGAKIDTYEIYKSLQSCNSTSGSKWIGLNDSM